MADNSVFITGSADGALTSALSELPAWATEDTITSIESILKKSQSIHTKTFDALKKCCASLGKAGGAMDADKIKKVNNEVDKLLRGFKDVNADAAKKRKRDKDLDKTDADKLNETKKGITANKHVNAVLTTLGGVGTKMLGVFTQYVDTSDKLFLAGVNVLNGQDKQVDSMKAMQQMVLLTNLRLETLQKVILKYSTTMNAVGVLKFGKSLSLANEKLALLGYNTEAQAELIGSMMEAQMGYEDIRAKSSAQIASEAESLGKQLTKLSLTVGMSREQLQESIKAQSRNTDSTLVAAAWGKDAAKNVAAFTAAIADPGIKKGMQQMAAAADPVHTQFYKDLQASGQGDLADQLARIAQDSRNVEGDQSISRLEGMIKGIQDGNTANLRFLIASGTEGAQGAADTITALLQFERIVSQASVTQVGAAVDTQASIAKVQSEIESFAATLQKAFAPSIAQLDLLAAGLGAINSATKSAIEYLLGFNGVLSGIAAGAIIVTFGLAIAGATKTLLGFIAALRGASMALGGAGGRGGSGGRKGGKSPGPGRGAGIGLGGLVAGAGLGYAADKAEEAGNTKTATAANIAGAGLTGLGYGAMVGSFIPVVGTAIGAAVGGALGLGYGAYQKYSSVHAPAPGSKEADMVENEMESLTPITSSTASTAQAASNDINTILSVQSNLLEQMVTNTTKLVSVNQEILRYSRDR